MASSQDLKHRTTGNQKEESTHTNVNKEKKQKRTAMAKRGLRSLAIAVAIPLSLTLGNIMLFGESVTYHTVSKPGWFPPLWAIHLMCVGFTFLMGVSAWLVWAEGGFHKKPMAAGIYLAQLGLSLAWDPIMFRMGASRVGLLVILGLLGTVVGCYRVFKGVNPIAGGLVKPCMAWVGYLSLVNLISNLCIFEYQ